MLSRRPTHIIHEMLRTQESTIQGGKLDTLEDERCWSESNCRLAGGKLSCLNESQK